MDDGAVMYMHCVKEDIVHRLFIIDQKDRASVLLSPQMGILSTTTLFNIMKYALVYTFVIFDIIQVKPYTLGGKHYFQIL